MSSPLTTPHPAHAHLADPHQASRERAERLLASVARELLQNPTPTVGASLPSAARCPSPTAPVAAPAPALRSTFIAGLRA